MIKKASICLIVILVFGATVTSAININDLGEKEHKIIGITNTEPVIIYPTKDTHVRHVYPNTNYGSYDEIVTRNEYGLGGGGYGIDTLIEFDLSDFSGDTIISASLMLYYSRYSETNPAGRLLTLYKITSEWDEYTVTWNNRPSISGDVSSSANVPSGTGTWMQIDVTDDVQDFADDALTNHGWQLMDETYWGGPDIPAAYFPSTDGSDNFPYLEVESENGGNPFDSSIVIGRIENLNSDQDTITFDAINVRVIQFKPFGFIPYTSGEEISISGDYVGILTPRFVLALCDINA